MGWLAAKSCLLTVMTTEEVCSSLCVLRGLGVYGEELMYVIGLLCDRQHKIA